MASGRKDEYNIRGEHLRGILFTYLYFFMHTPFLLPINFAFFLFPSNAYLNLKF